MCSCSTWFGKNYLESAWNAFWLWYKGQVPRYSLACMQCSALVGSLWAVFVVDMLR